MDAAEKVGVGKRREQQRKGAEEHEGAVDDEHAFKHEAALRARAHQHDGGGDGAAQQVVAHQVRVHAEHGQHFGKQVVPHVRQHDRVRPPVPRDGGGRRHRHEPGQAETVRGGELRGRHHPQQRRAKTQAQHRRDVDEHRRANALLHSHSFLLHLRSSYKSKKTVKATKPFQPM